MEITISKKQLINENHCQVRFSGKNLTMPNEIKNFLVNNFLTKKPPEERLKKLVFEGYL